MKKHERSSQQTYRARGPKVPLAKVEKSSLGILILMPINTITVLLPQP
ncbi:hypothetical protein PanWU01x14_052520 [Parasponia andersonii]|uniref:Uncharacterized protein n=1 Tax=Parasponia andersonii TaxID=3476 RepID=A0A2P5DM97_PARAD|nr:hypothetical protein PanWU01x14_052520 [Parasponia andersonii]